MFANGTAVVRSATSDMGPGTYTAMTQIAADALGMPLAKVRFEMGDSQMPIAKEHGGSTTTASIGPAVRSACSALLENLNTLRTQLQLPQAVTNELVLRRANLDKLDAQGKAESAEAQKQYSTYSFGAVFAEVHVDPDFGTVRVARIVGAYDAGRIINPRLAHSQCIGGMVQGIGMALLEETAWDERFGRVINANIAEYLIPTCADVIDLDAVFDRARTPC